jgi:maleate isomerase
MSEVLAKTNSRRIGLVTPYVNDIQQQIIANYACADIDCVAERHLDDHGNFSFANWSEEEITRLIREVAEKRPNAIVVLCTNFRAAPIVEQLEHELDIPIFDSIAVVVWKSLQMSGVRPDSIRGWGRLFESVQ